MRRPAQMIYARYPQEANVSDRKPMFAVWLLNERAGAFLLRKLFHFR
jgi:hypothetical protein